MQIGSIIFIIFVIFIWACSLVSVIDKWIKNNVPTNNIVSLLILLCPVINTLLALYYGYPEFKETLSKIFKKN